MQCFYCELNEAVDESIVSPITNEVQPTCALCEFEFETARMERERYGFIRLVSNLLLLAAALSLLFLGWFAALSLLAFSFVLKWLRHRVSQGFRNSRRQEKVRFAEEHGLASLFTGPMNVKLP